MRGRVPPSWDLSPSLVGHLRPAPVSSSSSEEGFLRWSVWSGVCREDGEASTLQGRHRPERTFVERDDAARAISAREYYQRGVSETKLEVSMASREISRDAKLFACQASDQESTLRQVVEERKLDVDTQAGQDQVVGLRHGNLRGNQRSPLFLQDLDHGRVRRVRAVRLGV